MTAELPDEVATYLATHHVMTLGTVGPGGPWAAAVFYAWHEGGLIFLSAPTTRHARNLAGDARCAATIHDDTGDWKAVKGLQIEGRVQRLDGAAAKAAREAYAGKFPLLSPLATLPPAITEALAKICWYRLAPARLYFIDNARGFGQRREFALEPPDSPRDE